MESKRTRKSAEARKAEIVDTAIFLAAELGPDRLTTEKLAREIGISQAAIFRHFATKKEIWLAVGHRIAENMPPDLANDRVNIANPVVELQELVLRQLRFIEKTPAIPAILFSRELHAENEALRLHFVDIMNNRQKKFASLIDAAKKAGNFDRNLNSPDAAALLLALIQGLAMRWSLQARGFDLVAEGERLLAIQFRSFKY